MHDLYKLDSKGKLRQWRIEVEGDRYRTVAGLVGGQLVESAWKVAQPKNVGRSNETSGPEQAQLEAESVYRDKLTAGNYVDDPSKVGEAGHFEPMLALKYRDRKKVIERAFAAGTRVFSQPKLDGFRNIDSIDGMVSRSGRAFVSSPHIQRALGPFFDEFPSYTLDGELYNHALHADFNKLQSLISRPKPKPEDIVETAQKVQYHVYDIILDDFPDMPFSERTQLLRTIQDNGFLELPIVLVDTTEVHSFDEIDEQYGAILEAGYEGQIIRIDGPYENKRTDLLIKRKEFFDDEYLILDMEEGKGNWAGMAKKLMFKTAEGKDFKATPKGTQEEMIALLRRKDEVVGRCWATVRSPNLTPDGKPRFGVVTNIYEGKRDI